MIGVEQVADFIGYCSAVAHAMLNRGGASRTPPERKGSTGRHDSRGAVGESWRLLVLYGRHGRSRLSSRSGLHRRLTGLQLRQYTSALRHRMISIEEGSTQQGGAVAAGQLLRQVRQHPAAGGGSAKRVSCGAASSPHSSSVQRTTSASLGQARRTSCCTNAAWTRAGWLAGSTNSRSAAWSAPATNDTTPAGGVCPPAPLRAPATRGAAKPSRRPPGAARLRWACPTSPSRVQALAPPPRAPAGRHAPAPSAAPACRRRQSAASRRRRAGRQTGPMCGSPASAAAADGGAAGAAA